jgi:membrane protein CcdC involved in cytochrome C biogenesis
MIKEFVLTILGTMLFFLTFVLIVPWLIGFTGQYVDFVQAYFKGTP